MNIAVVSDQSGFDVKVAAMSAMDEFGIKHQDFSDEGDVAGVFHACKSVSNGEHTHAFGFSAHGQSMSCLANKLGSDIVSYVVYNAAVAYRAMDEEANFLSFVTRHGVTDGSGGVDLSIRRIIKKIKERHEHD